MGESPCKHSQSSPQVALAQSVFDNPEWFYRHVDAHSLCCEYQAVSKDNHVVLCAWKGRAAPLLWPLLKNTLEVERSRGARDGTNSSKTSRLLAGETWGYQSQVGEGYLRMEHDQIFLPRLYLYLQGPV